MNIKYAFSTAALCTFLVANGAHAQGQTATASQQEAARAKEARDMTPTPAGAPTQSMREQVPASEVREAAKDVRQTTTPTPVQSAEKDMEQARRYREIANDGQGAQATAGDKRMWTRLDTDRDGRISQAEFEAFRTQWTGMDRDRDGYVSEAEFNEQP